MTPHFSFIAFSNTGKTTYIEKLIIELKRRGLRVAAVKHDAHEFEIDKEGKDSHRFAKAGADAVSIASATKCAVMYYRPMELPEILAQIQDVDIILVEGWHESAERKILIHREASGKPPKLPPGECFAVVSDVALTTGAAPLFPLDDVRPMADFLASNI